MERMPSGASDDDRGSRDRQPRLRAAMVVARGHAPATAVVVAKADPMAPRLMYCPRCLESRAAERLRPLVLHVGNLKCRHCGREYALPKNEPVEKAAPNASTTPPRR